uniref:Legumin-like protein n=1 Tax=Asarum europaeum TaxID=49456 RepID=Q38698_ASAEU|nr:legumin-like protein [Asarum europaeum]
MARSLLLLTISLSLLLISSYAADERRTRQGDPQQCRIQQLSASRPSRRIESEGGVTELWDENEEQFQCAGVAATRNIIQQNSLSLPNFSPSPRLVYIQQGRGLLGISYPGCAESYHSRRQSTSQQSPRERQTEQQRGEDQHQKVHRIRRGDIVALPAGAAHWCYNDGNEELIALSITDVNSETNQLDQTPRSFYLAGGEPKRSSTQQQKQQYNANNILRAFDERMMADAFDVPMEVVRKMQREDERGFIVKVEQGEMSMIRPDEEEDEESEERRRGSNGMEEAYCNMRINMYLDNPKEADVYSRQAGRLNSVNMNKLPILRYMQMSAEKGNLYPNAMFAPHWSVNAHNIFYVTRGSAQVQAVGSNGNTVFNGRVNEGDLVVVPQYFAMMKRADSNGFEWVSFKTSPLPVRSPLVGSRSTLKAMPVDVLANSFQISQKEAEDIKYNRENHMFLLPPTSRSQRS